jgi:DNA repair photolyase
MCWINPFNQQKQYISFSKARVFVFWSKNPKKIIKYLPDLDAANRNYYFHFTLNDYEDENLEPNIPPLDQRIATFKELSQKIGKGKVIWRFDPLILSDTLSINKLLYKIEKIGDEIHSFTERLVVSFVDIKEYKKVQLNLKNYHGEIYREFSLDEKNEFAEKLQNINKAWNLDIVTCAEGVDLRRYCINRGRCVDLNLMTKLFKHDKKLMAFLNPSTQTELNFFDSDNKAKILKDTGQRKECGCIFSKDIGQYNTCMHLCTYCYANHSKSLVRKNYEKFVQQSYSNYFSDSIIPK